MASLTVVYICLLFIDRVCNCKLLRLPKIYPNSYFSQITENCSVFCNYREYFLGCDWLYSVITENISLVVIGCIL